MQSVIFKAYDIRGTYPDEVNEEAFQLIANAYACFIKPKKVAVGRDVRLSSPSLQKAVIKGLTEAGVDVVDIGCGPTDMLYFAVGFHKLDGGIQVSASHNPSEYNGLKMIKGGVEAISSDTGLKDIESIYVSKKYYKASTAGLVKAQSVEQGYVKYLSTLVHLKNLPEMTIVANNNFGATGPIARKVLEQLGQSQVVLIPLNFEPDGRFPKGRPDPLVIENRAETSDLIKENKAQMAVAWDADGDRCYIADENGIFVEGCHLTALLAAHLLGDKQGEKIIYDPRNIWAVEETVRQAGGLPIINKAGHTFIKNRMKKENALFAGEMSGHFYFRNFYGADNGILPFLFFLEIIAKVGLPVSKIIAPLRNKFFVSGEVNFKVKDISLALSLVEEKYTQGVIDLTDGLSISFDNWRFNLRGSNTEPLLRLNVEAKDKNACEQKLQELTEIIATL